MYCGFTGSRNELATSASHNQQHRSDHKEESYSLDYRYVRSPPT
ncbi:hypothetical protein T01_6276 [Trichinella spiralis]|uniref:Uncharacterized protein n=1 Tax=Trichinella spiralis TaxID=6334 RepID=A0A0V1B7W5_TRISP|nr:hypothetical protein T01_6276 [Trichinella spiralis]